MSIYWFVYSRPYGDMVLCTLVLRRFNCKKLHSTQCLIEGFSDMSEPLLGHNGLLGLPALNICPHTVSRYVAECQLAKVHKFYAEKQYHVCAMVN